VEILVHPLFQKADELSRMGKNFNAMPQRRQD
jgi:hypothetical protein